MARSTSTWPSSVTSRAVSRPIGVCARRKPRNAALIARGTNLARYFSPNLVEMLATKDQPLGPVRRQVLAVLFADIAGFTSLAETLPPEQVVELLREVHEWMERVIFAHEGSIEGYIGDAVLAIFGVPEPGERDADQGAFVRV